MDLHGVTWKLYGTDSTAEASWRLTAGKHYSETLPAASSVGFKAPSEQSMQGTSHPIMKDLQNVQPEPLARCLHPHGEHPSQCKVHLCPIVKNEHQCSANTSYNIGQKSLVETPHQSLLSGNLLETVHGAFVDVFFHWLL